MLTRPINETLYEREPSLKEVMKKSDERENHT